MKSKTLVITIAIFTIAFSLSSQEKGTFTDARDGKIYKTVKIGTQTWMAENLAFKSVSGCWAFNDIESNVSKYGFLYDWETAKIVCPKGWHLPSDEEWSTLITYLGGDSIAGGKLKAIGTTYWREPNEGATNQSGFLGLPSGRFNSVVGFDGEKVFANWWSSTEYDVKFARYFYVSSNQKIVKTSHFAKVGGYSVRCVKD